MAILSSDTRLRTYEVSYRHSFIYSNSQTNSLYTQIHIVELYIIYIHVLYIQTREKNIKGRAYIHIYIYILCRIRHEGHSPGIAYALLLQRYDTPWCQP